MEKQYKAEAATMQEKPKGLLQDNMEGKEPTIQQQLYLTGLMKILHSKETSKSVDEMLKAAPPEVSIPEVALLVNAQIEGELKKRVKPDLETTLLGGVYLVSDLIDIGNTAGFFQVEDDEQKRDIMQATFQKYIEKGLADGSIDPIELQNKVEPLLNEQQIQLGRGSGDQHGVPAQPDQMTAMEVLGSQREQQGLLRGRQEAAKNQQVPMGGQ